MNKRESVIVKKAKSIDQSKIKISLPRSIIDGKSYNFDVIYNDTETLTIQFPRCQLFSGFYESDGKCYCEIAIPTEGLTKQLYFDIAFRIGDLLKEDRKFRDISFTGHIRNVINDFSCLRLKLPQNKSKITTTFVSKENTVLSLSNFVEGITMIPIVSIEHAYLFNETYGFNLLLKQVVILE